MPNHILITYDGETVAIAGRERFQLIDRLQQLPEGDPDKNMVAFMCAYAGDVLNGLQPGPYTDGLAEYFARNCLLDRFAVLEELDQPSFDLPTAARRFRVPVVQLEKRIAEIGAQTCGAVAGGS